MKRRGFTHNNSKSGSEPRGGKTGSRLAGNQHIVDTMVGIRAALYRLTRRYAIERRSSRELIASNTHYPMTEKLDSALILRFRL